MSLRDANPEAVAELEAAGHTIRTDDELVEAYAARYSVSPELARRALADELDDVEVRG